MFVETIRPTKRETLLFLAWIAGQSNIQELKTALAQGKDPWAILPAQLTFSLPPVFDLDSYGPVYQALFQHRMQCVDWVAIAAAIEGDGGVSLAEESQPSGTEPETEILWQAATRQNRVWVDLRRLADRWRQEPRTLVRAVRLLFEMHIPLLLRSSECAFLVQEWLMMALSRVKWRLIVSWLLEVPLDQLPEDTGESNWDQLQCALLDESLRQAARTFSDFGSDSWGSPDIIQLCLDLANRCVETRRDLHRLQEKGRVYTRSDELVVSPDRS